MADTFNKGDTVSLKSGGPRMTVDDVEIDGDGITQVWCVWFNEKGEYKGQAFKAETLEK